MVRHNLLTVSEFKMITHMGKHMHDRIISPRGKANAYKTSLTLPHLLKCDLVFMLGVSTLHLSTILLKLVWTRHFLLKCLYQVRKVSDHVYVCATFHDFGLWKCSDSVVFFLFFIVLDFSTPVSISTNSHLLCQYHLYCMKELYYRK